MQSKAATVEEYLADLPEDRRRALQAIRKVVRANLDKRIKEGMGYGMMGWSVPHSFYPPGYHCDPKQPLPVAGLASQKNHISIYLCSLYTIPGEQERFVKAWQATGKKLDMGKGCIRAKRLEDIPLEVIAQAVARIDADEFVRQYEASLAKAGTRHPGKKAEAGAAARAGKAGAARKTAKKTAKGAATKTAKATKKVAKKAATKAGARAAAKPAMRGGRNAAPSAGRKPAASSKAARVR